jgi:hypothetical protein
MENIFMANNRRQSDIDALLKRIDELLIAANKARGNSSQLINAAPLELHLYNIATYTKRDLEELRAIIQDFTGDYLKEVKAVDERDA